MTAAGRGRRARRALTTLLAFGLILGGGVFAVVTVLGVLDARAPLIERCEARAGEGTARLAPDQAENAALFAGLATHRGLPARAVTIAIATARQESKLRNIPYGDRDSLGLFQQRPSQGWGTAEQVLDPVYATGAFYDALVGVEGYEDLEITEAAQAVQRSAYPEAYAQHEEMARAFAAALTGNEPAGLTCLLSSPEEGSRVDPGAVLARLERDFVEIAAEPTDDGAVRVDVASLAAGASAAETDRLAWAVAQWAVATAHATRAGSVAVGDQVWERADGAAAVWKPLAEASTGPGQVLIR